MKEEVVKFKPVFFRNLLCLIAFLFAYSINASASSPINNKIFLFDKVVFNTAGNYVFADSNLLKQTLKTFMDKADSAEYAALIPYYDSGFLSLRVVDEGPFIKMDYKQMIAFWNMQLNRQQTANSFNHRDIINGKTTIYYIEISGDTATVILTRIKDLGKGPEPMFYDLTWINKNNKWYLFREIVHQRTMPSFH